MDDHANNPNADFRAPLAFCQNCGKPLTAETVRRVGPAIYCEPCLEQRLNAAQPASGQVPYTPVNGGSGVPPPAGGPASAYTGASVYPNPGLAALLGFIPGVGAMYNEQYAKGIVHLIVFALLVSLSDHNGIFGLFTAGWIFYMIIEAHHTARARRDGTPLPNPFGLNEVGERLGFGRAWPGGGPNVAGVARSMAETFGRTAPFRNAAAPPPTTAQQAPPPETNWGAPPVEPFYGTVPPAQAGGAPQTPYQPVNYGSPYPGYSADWLGFNPAQDAGSEAAPPFAADPVATRSSFPAGAALLIALGLLFLLATTGIFKGLPAESLVGFVILGFGAWVFLRCYTGQTGAPYELSSSDARLSQAIFALRSSLMLLIAGTLATLDGLRILPWRQSWPLFLIGAGLLALLNRVGWQLRARLLHRARTGDAPDFAYPSEASPFPGTGTGNFNRRGPSASQAPGESTSGTINDPRSEQSSFGDQ